MKKLLASLVMLFVFGVGLPIAANAQQCDDRGGRRKRGYQNQSYQPAYYQSRSYSQRNRSNRYYSQNRPSFYRRHRNLVNIGLAAGGGTIVGGLIGGRKGMLTGALVGGGAGALYTYVLKKKKRNY